MKSDIPGATNLSHRLSEGWYQCGIFATKGLSSNPLCWGGTAAPKTRESLGCVKSTVYARTTNNGIWLKGLALKSWRKLCWNRQGKHSPSSTSTFPCRYFRNSRTVQAQPRKAATTFNSQRRRVSCFLVQF
jgi:hypothetical protein